MSWMAYYVEVSMRQREDEIARRVARERQLRKQARAARGPRRHWWSWRRTAAVTRTPATPLVRAAALAGGRLSRHPSPAPVVRPSPDGVQQ